MFSMFSLSVFANFSNAIYHTVVRIKQVFIIYYAIVKKVNQI